MAETTGIPWTDRTWNPWRGCSKVMLPDGTPHPGCLSCYAERMSKRNPKQLGIWGDDGTRVRAVQKTFERPLRWEEIAREAGRIDNVFVDSMSDFFENRPDVAEWRHDAFAIMDRCRHLNFQILTKRPENVRRFWRVDGNGRDPGDPRYLLRENITLRYSASDQQTISYGVPLILQCSNLCPMIGISLEPFLGSVEFSDVTHRSGWVEQLGKPAMARGGGRCAAVRACRRRVLR